MGKKKENYGKREIVWERESERWRKRSNMEKNIEEKKKGWSN